MPDGKLGGRQFVLSLSIKYFTTQLRGWVFLLLFLFASNSLTCRLMWLLKTMAGIISKILVGRSKWIVTREGLVSLARPKIQPTFEAVLIETGRNNPTHI